MTLVVHPTFSKTASERLLKLCSNGQVTATTFKRQASQAQSIVQALADGADPNVQNRTLNEFATPLNKAAEHGHKEAVVLLLEAGAHVTWGPERAMEASVLSDEDEVYNGWPLDPLGSAMDALSWSLAHFDPQSKIDALHLGRVVDIALRLMDAGADPYLPDPATEQPPIESLFRYLNNDGLSTSAPVSEVTELLWRMVAMGPQATDRLRQVAMGQWQDLEHGWASMSDFESLGEPLRLKARHAVLATDLPQVPYVIGPRL